MTLTLDPPAPDILDDLTRRRFVSGSLGLGAIILSGCGDEEQDVAATIGDRGAFPITMKHRFGSTTIDAEPKRVVTAGFNDADFVLALGVTPVGVANFIGPFPEEERLWAREALAGTDPPLVSDQDGELRFERIAALDPDVIVYYSFLEEKDHKRLSAIAPTVVEPQEGTLWPQHTIDVGRALGREQQARTLVADVGKRFSQAREAHPEFAGTTTAILFGELESETNLFLLEASDPRVGLFTSLGLKLAPRAGEISREQARLLDQDLLVVIGAERDAVEQDRLLSRLDVVRDGRAAFLGGFETPFAGALGFDSPLSRRRRAALAARQRRGPRTEPA